MSCLEKMKDMTFICYEMKMNAIGVSTRNLVDLAQGESRNFEFFWIVDLLLEHRSDFSRMMDTRAHRHGSFRGIALP